MFSPGFFNQQAPTPSCEQQLNSIFEYNYTPNTSPVEQPIDQVTSLSTNEPSYWNYPDNDLDLTLGLILDLSMRSPYFGYESSTPQNDSSSAVVAMTSEINEQEQQQVPTDAPTNLTDATPINATHIESPSTDNYYLSREPINDDNSIPVYVVKKAKEPLRPCRVRIKEGKAPRHVCHVEGCDKDFSRNEHLQRHLKTHFGTKPYVCDWPDCERKFTRRETLERHKKKHSDDATLACDICGKNFRRGDCLKLHVKVHERAKSREEQRKRWEQKKIEADSRAAKEREKKKKKNKRKRQGKKKA